MPSRFFIALLILFVAGKAAAYEEKMIVALDGSGDYTSIQEAIYATKTFPWTDITIFIKNGVYKEKVEVFSWNTRVKLIGESRENTIITYDDYFDKIDLGRNSTFHTYTLKVAGNDFTAENLTIRNTSGPVGQAVALHVEADRAAFFNVSLEGFQDTLYVAGEGNRSYFSDCRIEGSVDFIFGGGTAYFEQCELVSNRSNSYITAASTAKNQPYGFVFNHCRFIGKKGVDQVYLGRPWRQYAKTALINSYLGDHIQPAGWDNWSNPDNEKTVSYIEINNDGPGAKLSKRVNWVTTRSENKKHYTRNTVLRGWQPDKVN